MGRVTKAKVVVGTGREGRCEMLRGSELPEPCNAHTWKKRKRDASLAWVMADKKVRTYQAGGRSSVSLFFDALSLVRPLGCDVQEAARTVDLERKAQGYRDFRLPSKVMPVDGKTGDWMKSPRGSREGDEQRPWMRP